MIQLATETPRALRRLLGRPLFTLVAVGSLALGLGGTTAIFSVVRTILLRPVSGIGDPGRLVDIARTQDGNGFDTVGYPDLEDLRAEATTLDRVYAWEMDPYHVRVGAGSVRVLGFAVSREYFDTLGVTPERGRFFLPGEETAQGGAPVAVVTHDFFVDRLAGDPAALGSTLHVNGRPLTLVGVAPADFHGHLVALRPEIFVPVSTPLGDDPWQRNRLVSRSGVWLMLGGRLAPGATLAQARVELSAIATRVAERYPDSHRGRGLSVLASSPTGGLARTPLRLFSVLLFVLVGLVLAIACLNVASMLLARGEERRREIAVRRAIGAPRGRIVGELLVETTLLFLLAAPPGLLLARSGVGWIAAFRPPTPFPVALDFPVDWSAAGFAVLLALVTGLLFGLAPALRAARNDPNSDLRAGATTPGRRPLRARRLLVAAQLAASLLLLVVGGLLLRGLSRAGEIDPGFDAEDVVSFEFNLDLAGRNDETARAELAELLAGARALPGVESASAAAVLPLDHSRMGLGAVHVDGVESPAGRGLDADANIASEDFFETLRIPVEGRDFEAGDHAGAERVAIVNRRFERDYLAGSGVGRFFHLGEPGPERETYRVIGVADDFRAHSLGEPPAPFFWLPASQSAARRMNLLVRSRLPLESLVGPVRELFRRIDPDLPPGLPRPLVEVAAMSTLPQRLAASIAASLGALGILLAALGLYGVLAFSVASRRREIAVRKALGAQPALLLRLVAADAAGPLAAGVGLGLAAGFAVAHALRSMLYGLPPLDLSSFAGACAILLAAAALACWLPARRVLALDPASALHAE